MIETRNYIDGQWVGGDDVLPNVNPSDTRDTVGEFAQAGAAQVEEAHRRRAQGSGILAMESAGDALQRTHGHR